MLHPAPDVQGWDAELADLQSQVHTRSHARFNPEWFLPAMLTCDVPLRSFSSPREESLPAAAHPRPAVPLSTPSRGVKPACNKKPVNVQVMAAAQRIAGLQVSAPALISSDLSRCLEARGPVANALDASLPAEGVGLSSDATALSPAPAELQGRVLTVVAKMSTLRCAVGPDVCMPVNAGKIDMPYS